MSRVALVVDDSMLIRHTVCRFLEERGFTVESATNGVQALELMSDLSPDIIITDMQMPKMDGTELISRLKENPETANIPIVILAGKATGADSAHEARADYIIFKDIDIETQLQKALVSALGDPAVAGF
ncbi:MAG TPA: response regulator [Terriglobales bacterium]|jgi:CheY-like chemotaxis protein|nr:response regulator [Terriglobales bacterium]